MVQIFKLVLDDRGLLASRGKFLLRDKKVKMSERKDRREMKRLTKEARFKTDRCDFSGS